MSHIKDMGPRGSSAPGQHRGGEAPGRKGGSARLRDMHKPVPPGGNYHDILKEHAREPAAFHKPAAKRAESAPKARRAMVGEVDKRPVCPPWCPSKYAMPVNAAEAHGPARFGNIELEGDHHKIEIARGPYWGYRRDYHRRNASDETPAAVQPAVGQGLVAPGRREVRAHPGLHGIRNEYVPAWAMKHPGNAGIWVPKYPKGFAANGPVDDIAPGRCRIAPAPVGQLLEFYLRRPDLREKARGHGTVHFERVGKGLKLWKDEGQWVDKTRAPPAVLEGRRLEVVRAIFRQLDTHDHGKIDAQELLAVLKRLPYRKQWDGGPPVTVDDFQEHLCDLLQSLMEHHSADVKRHRTFFTQSGIKGRVYLHEFEALHASFGSLVLDDEYFEQLLCECWDVTL